MPRKVTGWHLLFSVAGCGERRLAVGQPEQPGRMEEEMAGVLSLQTCFLAVTMLVCVCESVLVCRCVCVCSTSLQLCRRVYLCALWACSTVCVFSPCVCALLFLCVCLCASIKDAFPGSWQLCLVVGVPSFACCLATSKLPKSSARNGDLACAWCHLAPPLSHPPTSPCSVPRLPHSSFWHSRSWAAYTQSAVVVCASDHR